MERSVPKEIIALGRSDRGSYVIEFRLEEALLVHVGKLGEFRLNPGWYYYVGSAMGGLRTRIIRHIKGEGKLRWHVDYIARALEPSRVWIFVTEARLEDKLAEHMSAKLECGVPGFGCSDSRSSRTHLFFSPKPIRGMSIIDGHTPKCARIRS
jgi:Uri superfamily endonuclease